MPRSREILLPWDSQPQEAVSINWENPITRGLTSVISGGQLYNVVSGGFLVPVGASVSDTVGVAGRAKKFGDITSYLTSDITSDKLFSTSGATVLAVLRKTDSTYRQSAILNQGGTVLSDFFNLHYPWSDGNVYADFGDAGGAQRITYAYTNPGELKRVVFSAGLGGSRVVENGVVKGSNTVSRSRTDSASTPTWNRYGNTLLGDLIELYDGSSWSRELTEAECISLSNNPYQIFAPRTIPVPVSAGGGGSTITATLTQTLADATLVATGALAVSGSGVLAATLANATVVSAGAVALKAAVSQTLANATLSAASKLAITGVTARTLEAATLAATGSLAVSGSGVLAVTLANATVVTAGTVALKASVAQTLAPATLSAAGKVANAGACVQTLAPATLTASATVGIKAIVSQTLASATLVSAGVLPIAGALSKTLDNATLSAQGTAQTVTTGSVASTLANATVSAAAKLAIAGNATQTLADATLDATATAQYGDITGVVAQTLESATCSASATVLIKGSAAITLGDCTIVASNVPTIFTDSDWWKYEIQVQDMRYSVPPQPMTFEIER